jgi:hypothetical protein
LPGAGAGGADRIFVTFADGAVKNTWLRLTLEANVDTGLSADADYFFGNAAGETGAGFSPGVTGVDAADLQFITQELTPLAQLGTELISQSADLNHDRTVNAFDLQVVAANLIPNVLSLITPQIGAAASPAAVPEPTSLFVASVAIGAAGFGLRRTIRRRVAFSHQPKGASPRLAVKTGR